VNRSFTSNPEELSDQNNQSSHMCTQRNESRIFISDSLSNLIHKISAIQLFLNETIEDLKSIYELEKIDQDHITGKISELISSLSLKDEIIKNQDRQIINFYNDKKLNEEKLNEEKVIYSANKKTRESKKNK